MTKKLWDFGHGFKLKLTLVAHTLEGLKSSEKQV